MIDLVIQWLILTLIVLATAYVVPGVKIASFKDGLVVSALLAGLTWLLGRALFVAIGVGTLGLGFVLAFLTRWIVLAILLKLTDALTKRLTIKSFGQAFIAALVISVLSAAVDLFSRGRF